MKQLIFIVNVIILITPLMYASSLDDFSDDANKEIQSNKRSSENSSRDKSSFTIYTYPDDEITTNDEEITPLDFLAGCTYALSKCKPAKVVAPPRRFHDYSIIYKSFPYSGLRSTYYSVDTPYVFQLKELKYDESKRNYNVSEYQKFREERYLGERVALKNHFFILDSAFHYVSNDTAGGSLQLVSRFGSVAGIETSYTKFFDSNDSLGLFALGLNYGIFQTKHIMIDALALYSNMRGSIDVDGIALGTRLRAFPYDPLVLQIKSSYQMYGDINYLNLQATAGIMIKRFEIFGGYETLFSRESELNFLLFGTRIYF